MITSVGKVAPGKHGNGLQGVLYNLAKGFPVSPEWNRHGRFAISCDRKIRVNGW